MGRQCFTRQHAVLGMIGMAVLTPVLLLSGCGASSAVGGKTAAISTATPTVAPTATNQPIVTPPPAPISAQSIETAGCPPVQTSAGTAVNFVGAGGVVVSPPARALDYPSELMPSNVPNAPYQIPASAVNTFAPNPPVNPSLSTGYFIEICNQSGVAHTLTSMQVVIASFTPSSGPVNVWQMCDNGVYDAATKHSSGGCGGGVGGTLLSSTFTSNSTGASAPVDGLNWPATIDAHKAIAFYVGVNGLTSQGTYLLSFSLSVDGATPTTLAPSDGPFLIAPSAKVWTGTACQTPVMLAQIPAATQDTYYVCRPAA
jgi:hypothetical protein